METTTGGDESNGTKMEMKMNCTQSKDNEAAADKDREDIVTHFNWDLRLEADSSSGRSQMELESTADHRKLLPVVFRWKGKNAKTISISGSYDDWKSKIPLVESREDFFTIVEVPEGTHQYKYLVDGEWHCHPNEPMVDNDVGSKNNVFTIKESDCDLDVLLASDNSESEITRAMSGEFSQQIPPRQSGHCFMRSGPPTLPPQLIQHVLNREISSHCEPTLTVEPNHVVLNHLYTLSIKDGMLVMCATHRYRRKYITTLLYRPINT